jgi:hypothetical protein
MDVTCKLSSPKYRFHAGSFRKAAGKVAQNPSQILKIEGFLQITLKTGNVAFNLGRLLKPSEFDWRRRARIEPKREAGPSP